MKIQTAWFTVKFITITLVLLLLGLITLFGNFVVGVFLSLFVGAIFMMCSIAFWPWEFDE